MFDIFDTEKGKGKAKELFDKLLTVGYLTGSRAFGTARPDSDYDIIYPINKSAIVSEIIKGYEETPSYYFSGYTINVEGSTFNLIPLHPHEYKPWILATLSLTASLKLSGIKDRIKIHSIFMGMICFFKCNVEQLSTLDLYNIENEKMRLNHAPSAF